MYISFHEALIFIWSVHIALHGAKNLQLVFYEEFPIKKTILFTCLTSLRESIAQP